MCIKEGLLYRKNIRKMVVELTFSEMLNGQEDNTFMGIFRETYLTNYIYLCVSYYLADY